jgi:hypothetical protein
MDGVAGKLCTDDADILDIPFLKMAIFTYYANMFLM